MGPLLPPTPFNNLARGGLIGGAFVVLGALILNGAHGDPRVLFCGAALLLLGLMFLSALLKAFQR